VFQIADEVSQLQSRAGYIKILNACRQAQKDGKNWIWIDTVCIDKTSSAELSEAINSMFKWYMNATDCYALLGDVPTMSYEECSSPDSPFRTSRWFTRGWTLQVLITPKNLRFYSQNWTIIGSKNKLVGLIAEITKVPVDFLEDPTVLWASRRKTTRAEDMAYYLLGIFSVHMPLLYGEGGENAFVRLQKEAMKASHDQSLFAWMRPAPPDNTSGLPGSLLAWGILATHPSQFSHSASIRFLRSLSKPFSMTNKGLCIQLPILRWERHTVAILECALDEWGWPLGVSIKECEGSVRGV
jgi:hypothetical protein